jgi:hypothetical protein
MAPRDVPP